MMTYGVWQTCRHFSEPGLQPWAVSKSLLRLREWAEANIPRAGQSGRTRLFFAKHSGPGTDWTDAKWIVEGHLYQDGIKCKRLDPERYVQNRSGGRLWGAPGGTYTDASQQPTDEDWSRPTINIDATQQD